MKVRECMCKNVYCVNPETQLKDIAKLMSENHIGCVPVCDNNNCICGLLTDRDILLRTLACEKDPCNTKASDIMTTSICTCKENDEMNNAQTKMAQNQIRRLPVCDENNHVIGILTLGNLVNKDDELGKHEVSSTINQICDCQKSKNSE